MTKSQRNPEKFLHKIQKETKKLQRGKLKIYLGAAPGVGKTYAMLQDALSQRDSGLDVVIGIVESHQRDEINRLQKPFEILPRKPVQYRNKELFEFDLDAALQRNPGIILVDEMAHTNAPGLRHTKRWQDIKELLDRGIDVYTTLNVQHIESLNDDVSQIIHAPIKETVPDSMIELAESIELVDIPPEDLLKRLKEGKVYIPQQAQIAIEHFFRKGNLAALRELALRTTAERVSTDVLSYRQDLGIRHVWPTKEKILVCVGPGPESKKMIRAARRMATSFQADWIAVYVDVTKIWGYKNTRNLAIENLRFAEQLGGETRVLTGFDIVKEIMSFAREQNVTQIMVWKNITSKLRGFLFGDLADEIVRHSEEIDVYIMTGERHPISPDLKQTPTSKNPWKFYGIAFAIPMFATFMSFMLTPFLSSNNLVMIYLLGVTIVSLLGQIGPAIFASIISVLFFDFFFIPPRYSFATTDLQYFLTLIIMLLIALVISNLTILTRRQADSARFSENQTAAMHNLSKKLSSTRGRDNLLKVGTDYIADIFDSDVLALLPFHNNLMIRPKIDKNPLSAKEMSIAQWVFELGQKAGHGTDTLSFSPALYLPLMTYQGTIGVLRIQSKSNRVLTPGQSHLLEACVNQIAAALEADHAHEQGNKSFLENERDKVRSEVLKSISHDIRTPLSLIMSAANKQIEMSKVLDPESVKKLGLQIYSHSDQLNGLINNLLQITYLEQADLQLQKQLYSLKDIVLSAIEQANRKIGKRSIDIKIPDSLPSVPYDVILLKEVLNNLIDNALKFTPADSPIEISAHIENDKALVTVEDKGPGVTPDEVRLLFNKFYRGRSFINEYGLGLGLTICKRIIEAHGGEIWVENQKGKGAAFHFTLPLSSSS